MKTPRRWLDFQDSHAAGLLDFLVRITSFTRCSELKEASDFCEDIRFFAGNHSPNCFFLYLNFFLIIYTIFEAMTSNELLVVKGRCAELELLLAQSADETQRLRKEKQELSSRLELALSAKTAQQQQSSSNESFARQRDVLALTERNASLEQQLSKATEATAGLQKSIAREVQRARDEAERQTVFLRSQLLEQKEINMNLQEKVITAMGLARNLQEEGLQDACSETILITSDAVFHKFRNELRYSGHRAKYDVTIDFDGRHMILSGKRVNVQLLKAEVLGALNEMYASMVDPAKHISSVKAKEDATRVEAEHLRRTIVTHETTISSLHTALQHAQSRTAEAARDAERAAVEMAVLREEMQSAQKLFAAKEQELRRRIDALAKENRDGEETGRMALESLRAEAAVSAQYRTENSQLRMEIERLAGQKELSDRSGYVSAEQLSLLKQENAKLAAQQQQQSDLMRQLADAELRLSETDLRVAAARQESHTRIERMAADNGQLLERQRQLLEDAAKASAQLQAAVLERDAARLETNAYKEQMQEMRAKLMVSASTRGNAASSDIYGVATVAEKQLQRFEEENVTLRTELQQAFDDMRAVALSLKETRQVRERALEDIERLEIEKNNAATERQKLERQVVEERMASRQKEAEMELLVMTLRDEVQHQKRRIEMIHVEYQRRFSAKLQDEHEAQQLAALAAQMQSSPVEHAARSAGRFQAGPSAPTGRFQTGPSARKSPVPAPQKQPQPSAGQFRLSAAPCPTPRGASPLPTPVAADPRTVESAVDRQMGLQSPSR